MCNNHEHGMTRYIVKYHNIVSETCFIKMYIKQTSNDFNNIITITKTVRIITMLSKINY